MSFLAAHSVVRRLEGGTVDDPRDPGGYTADGVTQPAYDEWRGRQTLPPRPVAQITAHEIEQVYRMFWDDVRGDQIAAAGGDMVALVVFDAGVNHGRAYARKLLQWGVGATQDGAIGPQTLAKLAAQDPEQLWRELLWGRMGRYVATVRYWRRKGHQDPAYALAGWYNRLDALWRVGDPKLGPPLALAA